MTNASDIANRYERALKRTEQLASVIAVLSIVALLLALL